MAELDIAQVARASGLPASTLRFYEAKGLVASVGRRGLRRLFAPDILERLALISQARACGLPLNDIADALRSGSAAAVTAKIQAFSTTIQHLTEGLDSLQKTAQPRPLNHLDARLPYGTPRDMKTEHTVSSWEISADIELPWKPIEDRHKDRDHKRQALLSAAMRLFLEKGWHRATMQQLAERLNLTKPALYTYFASKEDILRACILLNAEITADAFVTAESAAGRGLDRLRIFLRQYAIVSCTEGGAFVHRIDDRELRADLFVEFLAIKRAIDRRARALIAAGVADGSIAPCDVRMTAFCLMGSVQSISSWYRPNGPLSSGEIADQFSTRLVEGLIGGSPQNGVPRQDH